MLPNLGQFFRLCPLRVVQIPTELQVQPESGARAKVPSQAQRRTWRDAAPSIDQRVDSLIGHANRGSQGSGMNILPCEMSDGAAHFAGNQVQTATTNLPADGTGNIEIGVRPEFVQFDDQGFPVEIVKVDDLGRHQIVVARHEGSTIKMIVAEDEQIPSDSPRISFATEHTRLYSDSWVVN